MKRKTYVCHPFHQKEFHWNRAAVACYAVEGAYPPDIDYLIENYRVHVDKTRYTVMYEYYGSNLKPSITVLENEKD